MAGIGFKLRQFVEEGSILGLMKGYFYSAILAAGPWLITIVSLGSISFLAGSTLTHFQAIIIYTYSFTLIYIGIFQFVLTRYLADKLYAGEIHSHIPTFLSVLLFTLIPQGVAMTVFYSFIDISLIFKLHAMILYFLVTLIWVAMIFLGVIRAFSVVILAFVAGSVTSIVAAMLIGRPWGELGYLAGYILGQLMILVLLMWVLFSEFKFHQALDFSFLDYFRRYPAIVALGFVYYLGIWADKFAFRFSSKAVQVVPKLLFVAPEYELSSFLAQLTIIPALAIFFLRVETEFFEAYREFYTDITNKRPYGVLEQKKTAMISSLKRGFLTLIQAQGLATLCCLLLTPEIFGPLRLSGYAIGLLRVAILGSFLQIMLFFIIIIMLYYEFYGESLVTASVFLIVNSLFTVLLMGRGEALHGWGYVLAAAAGLIAGVSLFWRRMQVLEFLTFTKQPIITRIALERSMVQPTGIGKYIPTAEVGR